MNEITIEAIKTRRIGSGARWLLTLAISAVTAIGAVGGGAQAASAASTNGDHGGATVACSSYEHTFTHTPYALPADGLLNQTIWYRIWVYDLDRRAYQDPIPRNGYLHFNSASNGGGAPTRTVSPGRGRYMVLTEYQWYTGGRWYVANDWTRWYWQNAWRTPTKDLCIV